MAAPLQHFPVVSPLLLTDPYYLPGIVAKEILRLNPSGSAGNAQVVIVGSVDEGNCLNCIMQ